MFGYSKQIHQVFILNKNSVFDMAKSGIKVNSIIIPLRQLSSQQWKDLRELQNPINVSYLRFRYDSPETYISLGYVGTKLAHIEWIVPAEKIRSRYHFVTKNSYSIISCLTSKKFRGLGIYPAQIQAIIKSNISAEVFWIWATSDNTSSLKGIRKAGGIETGKFVREKWFWGCMSRIKYFPRDTK